MTEEVVLFSFLKKQRNQWQSVGARIGICFFPLSHNYPSADGLLSPHSIVGSLPMLARILARAYAVGAMVSLYIDDTSAEDVRPTKDIDITMEIASLGELEKIREELIQKGFYQTSEDNVICRFRYEDIKVEQRNKEKLLEVN